MPFSSVATLYSPSRMHSTVICSDSQAALKALQSAKTTSSLVAETKLALKRLSVFNSVRLSYYWFVVIAVHQEMKWLMPRVMGRR